MFRIVTTFFFVVVFVDLFSQKLNDCLEVNFNEHAVKEKHNTIVVTAPGANLTTDRFGNNESALQIQGVKTSYLNLSISSLLKQSEMTISLWVKIGNKSLFGKGYDGNPIIVTRNSEVEDYNLSYCMFYDLKSNKFQAGGCIDSLNVFSSHTKDTVLFNKWYHLVLSFNNNEARFYSNGILQNKLLKGFQTKYNQFDSVLIGHSGSEKNQRYLMGTVDDIKIFNRVLSDEEIKNLYNEPNPNEFKQKLYTILRVLSTITLLGLIIFIMHYRNQIQLRNQKQLLELDNKINELELKVIRAQMSPHFISNCLAAIQELIYTNQNDIAAKYVAKFSLFLRKVLNYSNNTYISLEQELEMIKLNLELEQLRFKDNFKVIFSIDENIELNQIEVPALMTQPFIENAIWHGLLPLNRSRNAVLTINIKKVEETLLIEIEDNGVGRTYKKQDDPLKNKGTKMIMDKIDSLNKLSDYRRYELKIIDMFNQQNEAIGTKVQLRLIL